MTKEADEYNQAQLSNGKLTMSHISKLIEFWQAEHKLSVDGKAGSAQTIPSIQAAISPQPVDDAYPSIRCWPLRNLPDGREPQVTSGHFTVNPSRPNHYGCDLFYEYKEGDPPKKIGDSGRTKNWWIPEETYAIAPCDGEVVLASNSATGMRVWVQITPTWLIGFFHLDKLSVHVGQKVKMGDPVGRVNDNPADKGDADHLHFELFKAANIDALIHSYPHGTVNAEPLFLKGATHLSAV